jgi:tetratricopeptide (TPR) repeat protein
VNAAVSPRDKRTIEEAEGFMDLELPAPAVAALARVSPAGQRGFEWNDLRARADIALGRFAEALPYLYAAKDANPNAVSVYLAMGWCYKRTEQLPRAIEALRSADKLCRRGLVPDLHPVVMYNLSCYYALARRKSEMLHWLERALAADARFRESLEAEPDFDGYRRDADFVALANAADKS